MFSEMGLLHNVLKKRELESCNSATFYIQASRQFVKKSHTKKKRKKKENKKKGGRLMYGGMDICKE